MFSYILKDRKNIDEHFEYENKLNMKKKIVYIAHPIGGDIDGNLKDLFRIFRKLNLEYPNIVPIAPYVADVLSLKDHVQSERAKGMTNTMALLESGMIDEVWLTGELVSPGMQEETESCKRLNIPVLNKLGTF